MAPVCAPTLKKIIPLEPIHPFTKQIVPSLYPSWFPRSSCRSFAPIFCKSIIRASFHEYNIFTCMSFFLCFIFIAHRFCELAGAYVDPGSIFSNSLFIRILCSPISHSFLNGFQPNLYKHFSYVSSTCHTIFTIK